MVDYPRRLRGVHPYLRDIGQGPAADIRLGSGGRGRGAGASAGATDRGKGEDAAMKARLLLIILGAAFLTAVLAAAVLAQDGAAPPPYAGLKTPFPWDDAAAPE